MTTNDGNEFGWIGDGWAVAERTGDVEGLSGYLNDTKFTHQPLEPTEHLHVEDGRVVGEESRENEADNERRDSVMEYKVPNGVVAT